MTSRTRKRKEVGLQLAFCGDALSFTFCTAAILAQEVERTGPVGLLVPKFGGPHVQLLPNFGRDFHDFALGFPGAMIAHRRYMFFNDVTWVCLRFFVSTVTR